MLPEWYVVNPYVKTGYRQPTTPSRAFISAFEWHNETLNIYTHFLPGLFWLYISFTCVKEDYYVNANTLTKAVILYSYAGASYMALASGIAHTFHIVDKRWSQVSWKLDFTGIILVNLSHQILDTYILFYTYPAILRIAIMTECIFALFCVKDIITTHTKSQWRIIYPLISSTVLTTPAFLVSYIGESTVLHKMALSSLRCSTMVLIAGGVFLLGKFPERFWNPNGLFDNWNSHVWHHIFIVTSITCAFQSIPLLHLLSVPSA